MNNSFKVRPDWQSLSKEALNRYRVIGLVIMMIGVAILIMFVPTIKIWFKILGGLLAGYGFMTFLTANKFLNK